MSKINNIQLTVTIQRNFSFTPDEIRKVYPELDKQGIEDEDIVDWIMDNKVLDILEPEFEDLSENEDINIFYEGAEIDDHWSSIE
jgi:hypothetical protein